jgi:hypothetical protein
VFAASGLFGRAGNQETQVAECAIRLMAGMEAGFSPFASATGVHIINGRPAFSANLLAQAVRRHPDYDYRVLEKTAQLCRIRFLSRGEVLGEELFTIEMAERAGLLKNPTWRSTPRPCCSPVRSPPGCGHTAPMLSAAIRPTHPRSWAVMTWCQSR